MESAVADVVRIGGMELRFLVDETQGSGDLVMFEMTVQPNARVPVPHYHREVDEIVYGVSGVLTTTVNGDKREVRAGELGADPPWRRPSPRESRRGDLAHAFRAKPGFDRPRLFRGDRERRERTRQARSGAAEGDHVALRPRSRLRRLAASVDRPFRCFPMGERRTRGQGERCGRGSRTRWRFSPTARSAASSSKARGSSNWSGGRRRRSGRRDLRRFAPCRAAGPRQHPSSFLPDADPRPSRGDQQGAVRLARSRSIRSGRGSSRDQLRLAARLALTELLLSGCTTAADHHYLYPAGLENAVDIEVEEARALGMRMTVTRGSMNLLAKGRRPAARQRRAGRGDDPRRQRAGAEAVPRSEARRANPRRARALFAVLDRPRTDDRERAARRALRLPASHPSLRDRGRGALLPRDVRLAAGRSSRGDRLDVEPRLARARHSFQRRGDRAARQGGRRRLPLRGLEHGAGVRHLPDLRARGGGLAGRPRRRRLGLQRFLQHDGGGAPCADDRPPALRRRQRSPISTSCAGRRKARRAASGAPTSAGSRRATRPISRCSRSTSRASPARTIRSRRSSSAARIAPTG